MQVGFVSFSLEYYKCEIQKLESADATPQTIYHAKQLLKMLDDLLDEGYTELNKTLEESYQGVSRLREYLRSNGAKPFPLYHKAIAETDVVYEKEEIELSMAINELVMYAEESDAESDDAFLAELIRFCEWIGYNEDTAYIFLLRDTLLPYVYYKRNKRANIYPWLIGRKTLTMLAGKEFVDDEIRASIIKALEVGGCDNFDDFCKMVLPDMRNSIGKYPEIENCLTDLLNAVNEKHIIVIESGCYGTFPMLLKSLDDRVDVRMYTTCPYLLNIYGNKIYSPKYEENRLFETLYSQDLFFQFSAVRDNRFYVRKCNNEKVKANAYAEVKSFLSCE